MLLSVEWTQGKEKHYGYQYGLRFFMWCTIINGAWFVFAALIYVFASDWVYNMQRKSFPVSRDAYNVVIYSFFALFKIVFIVFNVVPFVALLIVE